MRGVRGLRGVRGVRGGTGSSSNRVRELEVYLLEEEVYLRGTEIKLTVASGRAEVFKYH